MECRSSHSMAVVAGVEKPNGHLCKDFSKIVAGNKELADTDPAH